MDGIVWPVHPSVSSSIHGWHHTGKKTLAEINNPSSAHVSLYRKGMPGLGLRSFTMVSCMLLSHRSQALQTSRFSKEEWSHIRANNEASLKSIQSSIQLDSKFIHPVIRLFTATLNSSIYNNSKFVPSSRRTVFFFGWVCFCGSSSSSADTTHRAPLKRFGSPEKELHIVKEEWKHIREAK
jgi:hypothetical protein